MKGRLVVRELRTPEEFIETAHVSKAAWGFAERSLSPASDLVAATHAGGLTAGAFEGKEMLGFVHGIPRTNLGEPCQHSHLLAVRPEAQGRGLGVKLKLFQRAWCLERGIRLVTWTYDPFLLKNAKLNLGRLHATVRNLLPDFYGHMGGIYAGLPTDRFEVNWRLDDPLVERAARGLDPPHASTAGVPAVTRPAAIPAAPRVLLPFLADAPRVYRTDPERSLAARTKFRRLALALFAKGYVATDVAVRDGEPAYVLDRTGDRVFA
ncbi:MAG TPA: GNAT family N-acetyltransferase [Thermoanaerobaculia bacterium]|nr:GNAT family N-acetyltransferase [Thermoanaerobaculia bacterium]